MPLLLREPEKIGKNLEKYDISGEQQLNLNGIYDKIFWINFYQVFYEI